MNCAIKCQFDKGLKGRWDYTSEMSKCYTSNDIHFAQQTTAIFHSSD